MQQPAQQRHEPLVKIASGGMATVFLGSLQGALGFRQIVAIKRPHPHLLEHQGFREELLREARLASGIHHANVVDVRDVEVVGDSIQLVMDYIEGASLGEVIRACARQDRRLPPALAVRIVLDACAGLHAAHELSDDRGRPLGLVHRDVSPQNILVGVDGVARVTDFGIAKCVQSTDPGTSRETLKGKIGYMAPEYVRGLPVDRRIDVFALGVVLWEALCGQRLFRASSDGETLERVLSAPVSRVSEVVPDVAPLDDLVARALNRDPGERFATSEDLAEALGTAASRHGLLGSHAEVGRFVRDVVGEQLEQRRRALRDAQQGEPAGDGVREVAKAASTRRDAPRHRRRARGAWVIAAASALGVAAAAALGLAAFRTRAAVSPTRPGELPTGTAAALSTASSSPAPNSTPAPTPSAAPDASAARVTSAPPAPTTTAVVPPTSRTPTRSRTPAASRASASHLPPPNPYPSGP